LGGGEIKLPAAPAYRTLREMARPVPGRGDDLGVLPGHIRDETVDLVYLREGLACCHGRHCFGRC